MRNVLGALMVTLLLAGPGVLAQGKAEVPTQQATPKEGDTLALKKGETKTFVFSGVTRVAVGDPEIADIEVKGTDTLLIKGASEGKTTLLVWTKDKARRSYLIDVK
jgi:pilus assembly protein CpaC